MFLLYVMSWFFRLGVLVHHCWSEFLKYNLVFTFEYSFQRDKCYYLFSTDLLLVFLMSIFDISSYDGTYFSCTHVTSHGAYFSWPHVTSPVKSTVLIEKSTENHQFPAHLGVLKSYLKLQEKDCLNKYI